MPIIVGGVGNLRNHPYSLVSREQFAPSEREIVGGLPCASVQRALFDEMRRLGSLRHAVRAMDMAAAAKLISIRLMAEYVDQMASRTGVPLAREALPLASEHSRSTRETDMRLVWVVDAGLPLPVCNQPVFDRWGRLLGVPDLFDPVAGLVGEYQGGDHRTIDRHRRDVAREELFRDHGLEYFEIVGGDLHDREFAARRMLSVRGRAKFLPPESCAWTLEPPSWWRPQESLDDYLLRIGAARHLMHR